MKKRKGKRKKSSGGGKRKGGTYEREICRTLSLWWSDGEHDDLFWRSAASGGRATVRSKTGKRTTGHSGDICSTDSSSEPLTRAITIECKRGYSHSSVAELIDKAAHTKMKMLEHWIDQAILGHQTAATFAWLIISRRNSCKDIVYMPWHLVQALGELGAWKNKPNPFCTFSLTLRRLLDKKMCSYKLRMSVTTLEQWLACVKPKHIRTLALRN